MYSEISIRPCGQALLGLRVQAPLGAIGIGTGTWAVLSSIPEGACACGAEGHMASIGPPALGAKGCVRSAQGGRRMAVRIAIEYHIAAQPRTPFPASRDFPSRGNEGYGEKNRRVIYFIYHSGAFPLWWLAPPPFPRSSVGAAKGKRLNGQVRRLTSPHLEVLCRTSKWGTITCAYRSATYERNKIDNQHESKEL